MIDWSKYFDKIFCIHYLPYEERMHDIKRELDRVGILNSQVFQWHYTVKSKCFDDLYQSLVDHHIIFESTNDEILAGSGVLGNFKSSRVFNLAINKLNLMMQAKELGYEKILVLEDDICFLKDLDEIQKHLDQIPEDFDIVNFDYWLKTPKTMSKLKSGHDQLYLKLDQNDIAVNFSCIAFSKHGIIDYVNNQTNFLKTSDYYVNCQKTFPGSKMNIYIPRKNLCIQSMKYLDTNNNNDSSMLDSSYNRTVEWTYQQIGLDLSQYMHTEDFK